MQTFTAGSVVKLTGLSYRTLDHWARTEFIGPSGASANGTGSERLYLFEDLVALIVARSLRNVGVTTSEIQARLEKIRVAKGTFVWDRASEFVSIIVDVGKARRKLKGNLARSASELN